MPKNKQLVSLDEDSLDILKDIPKGQKSKYIRDSIKEKHIQEKNSDASTTDTVIQSKTDYEIEELD